MVEPSGAPYRDEASLKRERVVVGQWSGGVLEMLEKGDHLRCLVRSGEVEKARALIQRLPEEEQVALVLVDPEHREEMLSLTGEGRLVGRGYNPQVVNLLPPEVLADLIAPNTVYLTYNTELMRALSPEKFQVLVQETLEEVDRSSDRRRISWEWLEAIAQLDDIDKRAQFLRGVELELLVDALDEVVHRFGFRSLRHFQKITELPFGGWPRLHMDDPDLNPVLDAVYEAAPDVLAEMIRRAWERSGTGELEEGEGEDE
jgi:hypothetical protein